MPPSKSPVTLLPVVLVMSLGCGIPGRSVDPTDSSDDEPGTPVLSLLWKRILADHDEEAKPQEFAGLAFRPGSGNMPDVVFVGSQDGLLFAFTADRAKEIWRSKVGAISSTPVLVDSQLLVGTDDGFLVSIEAETGKEQWRYGTQGALYQSPVVNGQLVVFSNEADQVYALDRKSGAFRWQYKSETPEENTLRGHAGVRIVGDQVITGFSNGNLVSLRLLTGSVSWLTSLKGEESKFVDVDTTPLLMGSDVLAASSSGGLYALDISTGAVRWRSKLFGLGSLVRDGANIYAAAADEGVYQLDSTGNVRWRQGTRNGGEPSELLVTADYLVYTLSDSGVYIADKNSGRVLQYFDPGHGVSATPLVEQGRMFVLSNSAILYSFNMH